jgi:hypothetical protein
MCMQDNYGIKSKPTTSHIIPSTIQMQSFSEYTKSPNGNCMLRSVDSKNYHENLEEQDNNPFDYFHQSNAWLPSY